jgi:hypothetical protein
MPSCTRTRSVPSQQTTSSLIARQLVRKAVRNERERRMWNNHVDGLMARNCRRIYLLRRSIFAVSEENVRIFAQYIKMFKYLKWAFELCFANSKHCKILANPKRLWTSDRLLSAAVKAVFPPGQLKRVNVLTDSLNAGVLNHDGPINALLEGCLEAIRPINKSFFGNAETSTALARMMEDTLHSIHDASLTAKNTFAPLYREAIALYGLVHETMKRVAAGSKVGNHCVPKHILDEICVTLDRARLLFGPLKDSIQNFTRQINDTVVSPCEDAVVHWCHIQNIVNNYIGSCKGL